MGKMPETYEDTTKIATLTAQVDNLNLVIANINKLTDFYTKLETTEAVDEIFFYFVEELKLLFNVVYSGLFLVDQNDIDFIQRTVFPQEKASECKLNFNHHVDTGIFGWAINQKKFSFVPNKQKRKAGSAPDSFTIIFPLKRNKKIFGACVTEVTAQELSREQQTYVSIISKQLALALGNAVYLENINHQKSILEKYNKKLDRELSAAKKIQQNIVSNEFPLIKNVRFRSTYKPYEKIGGDFFDVIKTGDDKFITIIADISGHGVPAAMGTAILKSTFYSVFGAENTDIRKAIKKLYRQLLHYFQEEQYMTTFIGEFDLKKRKLTYFSFGHLPVIQYSDGIINKIESLNGCIGIVPIKAISSKTINLLDDSTFLLFTDGILEACNEKLDIFGMDRLEKSVLRYPSDRMIPGLIDSVEKFVGNEKIDDDIAVLQIDILK